ncbi:hypothetical protein F4810DRAFT_719575 [Camillea tinctor]|nr:hypothetical protein F4810DRAFT_719575 [Camillea tinctor]
MEPARLAVGVAWLAGLPGIFRNFLEFIDSYMEYDSDSRWRFAQCGALMVFCQQCGEDVGYGKNGLKDFHHQNLDDPKVLAIVKEMIEYIHRIFAWAIKEKTEISNRNRLAADLLQNLRDLVPPSQPNDKSNTQSTIDTFKRNLRSWLGTLWTPDSYHTYVQRRLDGTCDWILQRPEFINWWSSTVSEHTKVLWVYGHAGYGKTILCARMIEYLVTSSHSPVARYFFSSDQETFQLAQGRWDTTADQPLSQLDIKILFKEIVQNVPGYNYAVDSLDECVGIQYDWKTNCQKQAASASKFRLILVSRNEGEIREGLYTKANGTQWDMTEYRISSDDVKSDAILFSRSIINRQLSNKTEVQQDELSYRMVERYDSMFVCIKMLEQQFKGGQGQAKLQRTIDQASSGLIDTDQRRALPILRWTTFALRPITVFEITKALLLVDDESDDLSTEELPDAIDEIYIKDEILDLCGSLIETRGVQSDPGFLTVHLTIFSVRQYILCRQLALSSHLLLEEKLRSRNKLVQNNILAPMCVRYLDCKQTWDEAHSRQNKRIHAFRDYATNSWHKHVKPDTLNSEKIIQSINAFFHPRNEYWELYEGSIKSGNPLFYALLYGLLKTMLFLIKEGGIGVNHVDQSGRAALLAASARG